MVQIKVWLLSKFVIIFRTSKHFRFANAKTLPINENFHHRSYVVCRFKNFTLEVNHTFKVYFTEIIPFFTNSSKIKNILINGTVIQHDNNYKTIYHDYVSIKNNNKPFPTKTLSVALVINLYRNFVYSPNYQFVDKRVYFFSRVVVEPCGFGF